MVVLLIFDPTAGFVSQVMESSAHESSSTPYTSSTSEEAVVFPFRNSLSTADSGGLPLASVRSNFRKTFLKPEVGKSCEDF